MKPDLTIIAHEVKQLAPSVSTDTIANFINKCHGTNYQDSDIEKLIAGIKPTASVPRHHPITKIKAEEPIAWTPPISTRRNGIDPLAKALASYHAKRTKGAIRAHWEAMAS